MIIDLNYLLDEIKEIYPYCGGLRRNGDMIEFALATSEGIHWFPYYRLPVKAQKYIQSLINLDQI